MFSYHLPQPTLPSCAVFIGVSIRELSSCCRSNLRAILITSSVLSSKHSCESQFRLCGEALLSTYELSIWFYSSYYKSYLYD